MSYPDLNNRVRWFRGRNNSLPGLVFLPIWLTGVAGVIGCVSASRANCLRWLGVFLLPFAAMPVILIVKCLRDGGVTWAVGVGSFHGTVLSDMGFDRDRQPFRFWLVMGLLVVIAVGVLTLAVLLLFGHWRLDR